MVVPGIAARPCRRRHPCHTRIVRVAVVSVVLSQYLVRRRRLPPLILTLPRTAFTHATTWVKDALGNATSRTDALSQVTTYALDEWERVKAVTYTGRTGDNKTFTYDPNSNLTAFTDVTGSTSRTYDNADRLTNESKGGSTVVAHSYDATGKKGQLSTTTDANGRVITYAYTTRGELYTVSESGTGAVSGTTTYAYDYNGNETGITNPNGTTVTKGYDIANRLTGVTNKNSTGTVLSSFTLTPNNDSQVTGVTEADGSAVSYGYDGQGHLTSEGRTGTNPYSKTYTVDGEGNRTAESVGGVSTSFTYDNDDELNSTVGASPTRTATTRTASRRAGRWAGSPPPWGTITRGSSSR